MKRREGGPGGGETEREREKMVNVGKRITIGLDNRE